MPVEDSGLIMQYSSPFWSTEITVQEVFEDKIEVLMHLLKAVPTREKVSSLYAYYRTIGLLQDLRRTYSFIPPLNVMTSIAQS